MVMERILSILKSCTSDSPSFPATILFNESWLLRLVLDWFSTHEVPDHPLNFLEEARWFSEASLPSAFLKSPKSTKLAESWSHVDGVIGHFVIGKEHKADLSLLSDARQLVVLEAKMSSPLADKTANADYWDQAARTIACVAETLRRAAHCPSDLHALGFYVLAPQSQLDKAAFIEQMSRDSIRQKVERRVGEYVEAGDELKNVWYSGWFDPTFQNIDIRTLSWEEVIAVIEKHDLQSANLISAFYQQCKQSNSPGRPPSTHITDIKDANP
jgi:hypothetical protein